MLRSINMQCLKLKPAWKSSPKFKCFSWVLQHVCSAEFQQPQETRLPNIRGLHTWEHLSDFTNSSLCKRAPSMRLNSIYSQLSRSTQSLPWALQEHTEPFQSSSGARRAFPEPSRSTQSSLPFPEPFRSTQSSLPFPAFPQFNPIPIPSCASTTLPAAKPPNPSCPQVPLGTAFHIRKTHPLPLDTSQPAPQAPLDALCSTESWFYMNFNKPRKKGFVVFQPCVSHGREQLKERKSISAPHKLNLPCPGFPLLLVPLPCVQVIL